MVEIIGQGGESDRYSVRLSTARGRHIKNIRRPPLSPAIMKEAMRMHTGSHPSIKLRSLSSEYNCMGLVFASRRAEVDVDELQIILEDDGYVQVTEGNAARGDIVVYRGGDNSPLHVGVVYDHTPDVETAKWKTFVLSQWGRDGEYFHVANDVSPLMGKPSDFWTDRKG
jgi:hypothetical protein